VRQPFIRDGVYLDYHGTTIMARLS
jgi:hypothetical protein